MHKHFTQKPYYKRGGYKLNKAELISSVSEKSGMSKKDCEKFLSAFLESVEETLVNGEKVQLVGFGSFEVRDRAARKGINPQTREEITIEATRVPVFRAGKALKEKSINS